jgi:hypothetical protein
MSVTMTLAMNDVTRMTDRAAAAPARGNFQATTARIAGQTK